MRKEHTPPGFNPVRKNLNCSIYGDSENEQS